MNGYYMGREILGLYTNMAIFLAWLRHLGKGFVNLDKKYPQIKIFFSDMAEIVIFIQKWSQN